MANYRHEGRLHRTLPLENNLEICPDGQTGQIQQNSNPSNPTKPQGKMSILCDHCKVKPARHCKERGGITVWVCDSEACIRWAKG